MLQLKSLVMGKPTSILQSLRSFTTLFLLMLGMLVALSTRHSHATCRSDFVCVKDFT